jgi:hypothetical protein
MHDRHGATARFPVAGVVGSLPVGAHKPARRRARRVDPTGIFQIFEGGTDVIAEGFEPGSRALLLIFYGQGGLSCLKF